MKNHCLNASLFADSQRLLEKEGRPRGRYVREDQSPVSRMVLAAKENGAQVDLVPSASAVWWRKAGHGRVWVLFPAPGNLCVLGEVPGSEVQLSFFIYAMGE